MCAGCVVTVLSVLVEFVLSFDITINGSVDPSHGLIVELRIVVRLSPREEDTQAASGSQQRRRQ